jgi:outer membrane protein assembly factor BamA
LPLTYALSTTDYLRIGSITPTLNFIRPGGSNLDIEVKATAEIDRATDQLDRTEFGIYSGLTWPIIRAMPLTFGLDFGVICFRNPDAADPWCSIDDYSPQFRPSIRWRWDTQDNPLNPSKGFMLSAEFKYIFGQSRDELLTLDIDESVGSELSNFLKWEASAEFAIGTPIGLIIAGLMRYGGSFQIGGDGAALLPSNEVFTLGGSNGLRGFADHAVGRYDRSGQLDQGSVDIAGNRSGVISDYREDGGGNVIINGSLELRMPVLRDRGVWLAGFLDGGALGRRHTDIHPESFRFSAGVGLRYLIGGQIPIRLDWGAVLGKLRCLEYDPQAALSTETLTDADCGTREDGHRIHFDLLYPF